MSFTDSMPKNEQPVVTALLTAILAAGKTVTINDGEEDLIESTNLNELQEELGGTGEDIIHFEGGMFYLIYNNGSEDDAMIVISDYSANKFCDDIWETLNAKYGE